MSIVALDNPFAARFLDAGGACVNPKNPKYAGGATGLYGDDATPAFQAAVVDAFGEVDARGVTRAPLNRVWEIVPGHYRITEPIDLSRLNGFHVRGGGMLATVIEMVTPNTPVFRMDACAYGTIEGIEFRCTVENDHGLVELDWPFNSDMTPVYPNTLKPQQLTFRKCLFNCNYVGQRGVWLCKSGGAAQGDTIKFDECLWQGCMRAGLQIGDSDAPAYNALSIIIDGGDIQGCTYDGIACIGGNVLVRGTSFQGQDPTLRMVRLGGADLHVYASVSPSKMEGVRSESPVLAIGNVVIDSACEVYGGGVTGWQPETPYDEGSVLVGTPGLETSDGAPYIVVGASKTAYRNPANTGDLSHIDDPGAAYDVDEWAGFVLIMRYPNGFKEGRTVASNTATRITLVAPLTYAYIVGGEVPSGVEYKIGGITGADEPDWLATPEGLYGQGTGSINAGSDVLFQGGVGVGLVGHGVVVNGAGPDGGDLYTTVLAFIDGSHVQLAAEASTTVAGVDVRIAPLVEDNSISLIRYDYYGVSSALSVRGLGMQFGRVRDVDGEISFCKFSRRDWLRPQTFQGGGTGDWRYPTIMFGNRVGKGSVHAEDVEWSLLPGTLAAKTHVHLAGMPIVWDTGQNGIPFNTVGIDRGDGSSFAAGSDEDLTRSVLAVIGTLGRHTKGGADVAGEDLNIQGGLGTGTGGGGAVNLRVQRPGASGTGVPNALAGLAVDAGWTEAGETPALLYDPVTEALRRVRIGPEGSGPGGVGQALFVGEAAESGGGGEAIVEDTFTRADSSTSLGSAETGQAWTAHTGTWGIASNQAYVATPTGEDVATVDAGVSDGIVSVLLAVCANARLVFRLSDASNYWIVQAYTGGSYRLFKFEGGYSLVDTGGSAPADGDEVSVSLNGNAIAVSVNGVEIITTTDSFNASATRHGLNAPGSTPRFDNFAVNPLP